jgi:hypothetical protein
MGKPYERERDGARLGFHGMNTVLPPDRLPAGKFPYAQNVRAYLRDRVTGRATQDSSVTRMDSSPVHSIRRLNDSTPAGPPSGFILVGGVQNGDLYANNMRVDNGLSGNPISLLPFRPNASVQPWMYVGDSLKMDKVRSDGLRYKMGIAEPQAAPSITFVPASDGVSLVGAVTVTYYNNLASQHSTAQGNFIFKNASDPSGAGPLLSSIAASGVTTGNSLLFDLSPTGSPSTPMEWTQYTEYQGTVTTAGTSVTWDSGSQFNGLVAGETIVITGVSYQIAAFPAPTNTTLTLTTSAGTQSGATYFAAAISGVTPVFQPALEPEGYSDFSLVVEATLYIPSAGTYNLVLNSKDETIWGIGNSANGKATWAGPTGGQVLSLMGQTITAQNGYPLLPKTVTVSGGQTDTANIAVTFSAAGNYPIELNYDYWYHSGRTLTITNSGVNIPPIPGSVITDAQYRYVYRSSATGALSNPSPPSAEAALSVLVNTIQATFSPDPQVDKIDYYRLDTGLENYTYVGTGINSNPPLPFSDTLLDADVAANPILEFDNYEPFPSIDLPAAGTVNISGGVVTWASGTRFNIRWLPGTIIIIGTAADSIAYTLDKRPTSTTQLTASNVENISGIEVIMVPPDGTGLLYAIQEPDLADQPLPYIWGPTDNITFFYGVGDPLRPGVLYWSKGANPDSAPQTNQQDVTSPSEPLQNGCIVNGVGWVASAGRGWLILPNFFNAEATVLGTTGSTWTLQESSLKRGLYMPHCLAVEGGHTVFFRAKDGIYVSPGGQGGKSITDDDLFNLFPHEGFIPQPVTIGGFTVYPPDDTQPQLQKMNVATGYLYYDYVDVNGNPRHLVFDIAAGGWVVDIYGTEVSVHILEEGPKINGVLCGCMDGTIRPLTNTGAETCTSVLLMPSAIAGDVRALKHWADIYIEGEQGE